MSIVKERDWIGLIRFVVLRYIKLGCHRTAAAMTYTTLFALVPMMTVAYAILAALPSTEGVSDTIEAFLFRNLLPESGLTVSQYLSDFAHQARSLTLVGVLFLVVTAILMMRSIERAFNEIWSITEDRSGAASFLLYWSVLTLGPLLMGASIALTSYIVSHRLFLDATETLGITPLLQFLPLLTSALAFMMLYHLVPNCYVPLHHALSGGVFTALCFEVAKGLFTQFVSQSSSYQVIYGAFAAVPLFLLWLFISWNLLLLGAILVMALSRYNPGWSLKTQSPFLVTLTILQELYTGWRLNQPVSNEKMRSLLSPLSLHDQQEVKEMMVRQGLMAEIHLPEKSPLLVRFGGRGSGKGWILTRDINHMTLWQLLSLLPWPVPANLLTPAARQGGKPADALLLPLAVTDALNTYLHHGAEQLSTPVGRLFSSPEGTTDRDTAGK